MQIQRSVRVFLVVLGLIIIAATPVLAGKFVNPEGASDHALVPKFPGAEIVGYEHKNYDEFILPLSTVMAGDMDDFLDEGKIKKMPPKWRVLEGDVTRLKYLLVGDHSSLEVFKNYEHFFKKNGFSVLFANKRKVDAWYGPEFFDFSGEEASSMENWYTERLGSWGKGRYIVAKLSRPEGDVYAAVGAREADEDGQGFVGIWLNVVEVEAMEQSIMDAEGMARSIVQSGSVSLYGIYFDTGKAEIKPRSKPTLAAIAELMNNNSGLKLYVVGHTDSAGVLESNLDLSRRRAEAVYNALVQGYGIAPGRLRAAGVGPYAPVASNATEKGRAKNRRVELVAQ